MNGKSKSQDDPNVRILRDLTHIPGNKYCFDCGQRGPTYVNITIGSFVCMSCSGLLRGLTPPHRVKSISMASFTPDEIEQLKSKGNEYCKRVWLATCSTKDSYIGSEKDPDRVNLLRNFMSSKYEQKRFYVDPSRLPRGELSEIQAQTARALSTISQSGSNGMQKSPSLSSTRSSGSQHSNPSPSMSSSRPHSTDHSGFNGSNRLVNSITLPDIKPLSSLMGSTVPSITTNQNNLSISSTSGHSSSIDFINNLSSTTNQSATATLKPNLQPSTGNLSLWSNNFSDKPFESTQQNFADFEDAFRRSELNPSTPALSINQNNVAGQNGLNGNSGLVGGPVKSFLQPYNGLIAPNQPLAPSNSSKNSGEDKYAALKDLDSLFKQSANGDVNGGGSFNTASSGLPNSTSLPANLSATAASSVGWFSTSPNQNPFAQAPAPSPQTNGWSSNHNGVNDLDNGSATVPSTSNPFVASSSAWKAQAVSANPNARFFQGANSGFNGGFGLNSIAPQQGLFPTANPSVSGQPANPFFSTVKNPHNPFL